MVAGAVYSPLALIVPATGVIDHEVPWLLLGTFVTVDWNCWLCPAPREAVDGLMDTITGRRLIGKLTHRAPNVEQAWPVTVVVDAMDGGAGYRHVEEFITPVFGLTEQVNVCGTEQACCPNVRHPRLVANCCFCETSNVALAGNTCGVRLTARALKGWVPGAVGGGRDDVIDKVPISDVATGSTARLPVTVVVPVESGTLMDPRVKVTPGAAKLAVGVRPNPVPLTVTGVLSPELTIIALVLMKVGGAI